MCVPALQQQSNGVNDFSIPLTFAFVCLFVKNKLYLRHICLNKIPSGDAAFCLNLEACLSKCQLAPRFSPQL